MDQISTKSRYKSIKDKTLKSSKIKGLDYFLYDDILNTISSQYNTARKNKKICKNNFI